MSVDGLEELIARWDAQQARYLPGREQRFELICDLVEQVAPSSPRILDLCAGPGSLSARLLERLPRSSITAVDFDPAHIELGRRRLGGRVTWCEIDLRRPGWDEQFGDASFDAVVTATAIHWFTAEEIVPLTSSSPAPRTTPTTAPPSAASLRSRKTSTPATAYSGTATREAPRQSPSTRPRSRPRVSPKPGKYGGITPTRCSSRCVEPAALLFSVLTPS